MLAGASRISSVIFAVCPSPATRSFHFVGSFSMASLSEKQLRDAKELFSEFDKEKNGKVESQNLGKMMRALGQNPTESNLKKMIQDVDENKGGKMDLSDFLRFLQQQAAIEPTIEDLREAFKEFDKDHNGFLDRNELKTIMTTFGEKMTDHEAEEMMKEADVNGDGKINYEEFVKVILDQ